MNVSTEIELLFQRINGTYLDPEKNTRSSELMGDNYRQLSWVTPGIDSK